MSVELNVKQNTILCQECGEVIDTIDSSEGVKTWFGICTNCAIEKQASVID
ncbi:GapA-binding peptide SR1P [Metabacillus sediminilitoris]|uniref:GapA-binding peptide SR1P n=1 Tax=Metabacillus sediminilitoris TaxID=2567941 RepID=A0A4S4C959_9BACI|nr:GapA-binding peptide SR1P [Metabacillus sediminilitoris]QGQ45376.1 GapA-binding peptide SR1P [Metabacillus sediminilitoris]THF82326.1 GapA-binding peptide SR1P [Metabacillus sediminilitoris]